MTDKPSYEVLETNAATQQHINLVRILLRKMAVELLTRGEVHDLSKFSEAEAETFAEFTPKLKGATYGSPEYKGFLAAMGPALAHHYVSNRHHPEHFGSVGIEGMNLVDVLEMFIDWFASTKRHADGDIMKSIDINRDRFKMDLQLVRVFQNTVRDFFPEELKYDPSDLNETPAKTESIFSDANKRAAWDKAYALIVADVGEKEAALMLERAAAVAAQAVPFTRHDPDPEEEDEPRKPRPEPLKVEGPNTWICQDCNTEQSPPSDEEEFCCRSVYKYVPHEDPAIEAIRHNRRVRDRDGTPCKSEDIFDMNEASWPCPDCGMPAVTYLDKKANISCEDCWEINDDDRVYGL